MPLQLRRGTDAQRQTITPALGEPIWTTDTKKLYLGDGVTIGGVAVDTTGTGGTFDPEAVDDRVAALLRAGTGIGLSYDDVGNALTISATGGGGTGGLDAEGVDDRVATLLRPGANVSLNYDDLANTLTISATTGTATGAGDSTELNYAALLLNAGDGITDNRATLAGLTANRQYGMPAGTYRIALNPTPTRELDLWEGSYGGYNNLEVGKNRLRTGGAHEFEEGDPIIFPAENGTPPAPLATNQRYYVVSPRHQTFMVASTPGGAPIAITQTTAMGFNSYRVVRLVDLVINARLSPKEGAEILPDAGVRVTFTKFPDLGNQQVFRTTGGRITFGRAAVPVVRVEWWRPEGTAPNEDWTACFAAALGNKAGIDSVRHLRPIPVQLMGRTYRHRGIFMRHSFQKLHGQGTGQTITEHIERGTAIANTGLPWDQPLAAPLVTGPGNSLRLGPGPIGLNPPGSDQQYYDFRHSPAWDMDGKAGIKLTFFVRLTEAPVMNGTAHIGYLLRSAGKAVRTEQTNEAFAIGVRNNGDGSASCIARLNLNGTIVGGTGVGSFPISQVNFCELSYDGSTVRFFVNGTQQISAAAPVAGAKIVQQWEESVLTGLGVIMFPPEAGDIEVVAPRGQLYNVHLKYGGGSTTNYTAPTAAQVWQDSTVTHPDPNTQQRLQTQDQNRSFFLCDFEEHVSGYSIRARDWATRGPTGSTGISTGGAVSMPWMMSATNNGDGNVSGQEVRDMTIYASTGGDMGADVQASSACVYSGIVMERARKSFYWRDNAISVTLEDMTVITDQHFGFWNLMVGHSGGGFCRNGIMRGGPWNVFNSSHGINMYSDMRLEPGNVRCHLVLQGGQGDPARFHVDNIVCTDEMGYTRESPLWKAGIILDQVNSISGSGVWFESPLNMEALPLTDGTTVFFQDNATRSGILIAGDDRSGKIFLDRWAVDISPESNHIEIRPSAPGVILNKFGRKQEGGLIPAIRTNNATKIVYLAQTATEPA